MPPALPEAVWRLGLEWKQPILCGGIGRVGVCGLEGCLEHFPAYMDLEIWIELCVECWVNIGR